MKKLLKFLSSYQFVVILAIAAVLRLYRIGEYMTFLGDEGRDVLVVYNILHGQLTLLGPTSSVGGFFLGPIYYYFMAPFLWLFNYDPVGPAVMVALFGVATVYLIYWFGSTFFNKNAGLIAALLYAMSPLVIAYSRSSWQPNPLPFFVLLTFYCLYQGVYKDKKGLIFLCGLWLGIVLQLHYLGTFVGAIIAVYVLFMHVFKNKITLVLIRKVVVDYLIIFGGFLLGWSPFLAFEFRHGFQNIQNIIKFIFHSPEVSAGGANYFSIVGDVIFRLFARLIFKYPPPEQISLQAHPLIALWFLFILACIGVIFYIFIDQYKHMFKEKNKQFYKYSLIATWFIVGFALFGFYKKSIYDYYFQFMFPLPFLLIGNALSYLWKKPMLKIGALSVLIYLVWINYTGVPFFSTPNRQKDQVRQIAEFVLSKINNKPYNFALIAGGNSDHGYRYFFKLAEKDPKVILNPALDPQRTTVTDQLLVVCEDANCHPLGAGIWEVAGFGRAEITEEWTVSVVKVYRLVHYTGK